MIIFHQLTSDIRRFTEKFRATSPIIKRLILEIA